MYYPQISSIPYQIVIRENNDDKNVRSTFLMQGKNHYSQQY